MPFELCYITDRHALAPGALLERIRAAALAGVDLIQIREKDLETRALIGLAKAALEAARGTPTRLVVNDRLDVAQAVTAHGVHLGNQSLPAEIVRRQVEGDFLVGVSCHSLVEALAAEAARADYLFLGPIFATPSKASFGAPLGWAKLREVAARVAIPVIALGGVTHERARSCYDAGAAGVAGIRIFQEAKSVEERVRELRDLFAP